ncbi:hypothetical protein [Ornithinimicrobium murale]|uniref:hypothetical protein n=1 Tax=Ornithinimicrobium murale TaxID=1050153 RepID=UPI000E0E0334|nr:hypothetical protein [Ornithinimicrobium murale]
MDEGTPSPGRSDADLPLQPALTLTEEELLVLTKGSLGIVPRRIPQPEDPAAADLMQSMALRTLMARGLVLPTGAPTGEGVSWEVIEPLGLTLQLRELAPAVLGLHRVLGPLSADATDQKGGPETAGTHAVRYLHLHEEIAVIEDVTDSGMHGLLTVFPDRYQDAVADFIRPPDATPGRGAVRVLDGAVEDLLEALGHPTVLVEASRLTGIGSEAPPTHPLSLMLALGPGGTFRAHDSVSYHPVDPDGAIAELLCDTLSGVGTGAGTAGPT